MRRATGLFVTSAALALIAGCSSNPDKVSFSDISGNLTPELQTTAERPADVDLNMAMNNNQNLRMFWDDLGRSFYTDRPSLLSPYPIVPTSGTPR